MKKIFAGLAAAVVVAAGGLAAIGVFSGDATAQEDDGVTVEERTRAHPVLEEALAGLVDENVITQDQADAIMERLRATYAARHDEWHGRRGGAGFDGFRGPGPLGSILEQLGMTPSEVAAALEDGATLADLAEQAGLDPDVLIADAVADAEERLQALVDAGRVDAETAAARIADLEERITDIMNGEGALPFGRRPFGHRGFGHRGFGPGFGGGGPLGNGLGTEGTST